MARQRNTQKGPLILVVDDDESVRSLVVSHLEADGYQVREAATAADAEAILERNPIDVVLLDIRMPGKDGLTLTREIRARSEVGIILITGSRKDHVDRVVGLELGADHFVTKPVEPRELLARVKNLARRASLCRAATEGETRGPIEFDGWILDPGKRQLLTPDGIIEHLTEGEYQVLSALIDARGRVMSRNQILERVLDRDWDSGERTADVLIARLRRKLRDSAARPKYIVTVHGAGYLFTAKTKPATLPRS